MTWRRPHWRERPSHPEDDLKPPEAMRVPTFIRSRALARGISGPWMPRRSGEIEDSASQLVLPTRVACFDLAVAHKLNIIGNGLTAKARELWSQERKARQTQKLVDPRSDDKVATH